MAPANSREATEPKKQHDEVVRVLLEYVLPVFLILTFVGILVMLIWIGPVGMFKFILSFIPAKPGPSHALILGAACVVCIVLPTPFWPPLMIVIAMVFGFWMGFLIDWCAMVLGALISFVIGRWMCMRSFREYIGGNDYKRVRRMMLVVEEEDNSLKFMFLFRFLFLPIWLRNYLPSLTHVSVWYFMLPVCVHAVWICAIFASVGAAAKDLAEAIAGGKDKNHAMDPNQLAIFSVSLVCMLLISWLAYREYADKLSEEEVEPFLIEPVS
jgi:uncharacterized membrane protein YdjX (TVP38/TMEM64 family)